LLESEDQETRLEAAELLHPIYEAEGAHEKLLRVVEVEAKASDDPAFRASRFETAVLIAEDALGDDERAMRFALAGAREAVSTGDLTMWLATLERLAPRAKARAKQVEVMEEVVAEI